MFKRFFNYIIETIKEEYKFLIFLTFLLIVLNIPLNYYIVIGGGISDASSRIEVDGRKKSNGSFNISYVTQLDANILFYGMSYIIPSWEREDANLYKYTEDENLDDIQFRSDLDLMTANGTAIYWAYTLAGKKIEEKSSELYAILTSTDEYATTLKVGDQILSMDGKSYNSVLEYSDYLQTKEQGDLVNVKIIRKKKEMVVETPLYEIEQKKMLGIGLQYVRKYKTEPEVHIKFNRKESGPSGGLITTLEIFNQLTKTDLTQGYTIAGTGTIEEDGSIGEIGGIEHKLLGASTSGADIFLCPGGDNYNDAVKYAKKKNLKIKIIKVETIQQAVDELKSLDKKSI